MEDWRRIWREQVEPRLPAEGLKALAAALATCDGELTSGTTVAPWVGTCPTMPPLCACPVGYALWKGRGLRTVFEVQAAFSALAAECSQTNGWSDLALFTGWVDAAPWSEVRQKLLAEVHRSLALREGDGEPVPVVLIAEE